MERILSFSSTQKLTCSCEAAAPVLLKVTPALISATDCPDTTGTYTQDFIQATLQYADYSVESDCDVLYTYTVKYDDSVLVSYDSETQAADPALYSGDILGVICDDTMADWVRQQNGEPITLTQTGGGQISMTNQYGCVYTIDVEFNLVLVVADTATVDLTLAGSNLSADVKISADSDNLVTTEADGIKVQEIGISGTDSITFNTNTTDSVQSISAQVVISADAGNQITVEDDGLFVPAPTAISGADTSSVDTTVAAGVVSSDVVLSADADNVLTIEADGLKSDAINAVNDSATIDLTKNVNVLEGSVKVSADGGNIISAVADGLFAASSINVNNTTSILHTFATDTLSSDVKISADADNILTIEADGLKSDAINAVTDTNSVNLTKTNNDLQADVIVSPDGGNLLQELANGMYVAGSAAFTVDDTNSVDMTIVGNTVSADVLLSADGDNTMTIESDGVKAITVVQKTDTATIDITVTGNDTISADVNVDAGADNVLAAVAGGLKVGIDTILNAVYPIGTIYESYSSTNPASYSTPFPGTWVVFGTGQTTIGVDASDSSANSPGEISGNDTINLNHYHKTVVGFDSGALFWDLDGLGNPVYGSDVGTTIRRRLGWDQVSDEYGTAPGRFARTQTTTNLGSISVRQPSVAVYRWRRTA